MKIKRTTIRTREFPASSKKFVKVRLGNVPSGTQVSLEICGPVYIVCRNIFINVIGMKSDIFNSPYDLSFLYSSERAKISFELYPNHTEVYVIS